MTDRTHGGNYPKRDVVDFSVNISPIGLPEGLLGIISRNRDAILRYPEASSHNLIGKLAARHHLRSENIAAGNGSIELIYLLPRALKIKRPLIVVPTFSEYEFALKSGGVKPEFFETREEDGFRIDNAGIERSLPPGGALFLCNPNNPTGYLSGKDDMLRLIRICAKKGAMLIIDEAFIDFVEDPKEASMLREALNNRHLVILRSLTKIFAMPGLRLGYAVGHCDVISRISRLQYPWNINGPAQLAAEKALADKKYMSESRLFIARERTHLFKGLSAIDGLKVYPSSANFILCKLRKPRLKSAAILTRRLLRRNIYIRDCRNFRGLDSRFFRVAVRSSGDNDLLINSVKKALR